MQRAGFGEAATRSLISFIRAKILLENQLEDLNAVLEEVDPRVEAFDPTDAYTSVIKSELIKRYAPWVGGGPTLPAQ